MNISGQIALVTGASSGIGAACATALASSGCKLIIAARRTDKLEDLAKELRATHNVDVLPIALDVTNKNVISKAIAELPEKWQDIDILINNAGLALGTDLFQDGDSNDWDRVIDTNVKGVFYVTRAVIKQMLKRNHGHIINIGSIAGHMAYPGGTVYCASKAAIKSFSEGLKHDVLGSNIRVTSVDPGLVETDFSLVRFKGDADRAESVYQNTNPLLPEDIADVVVFCATRPQRVNISSVVTLANAQSNATRLVRDGKLP